MNAGLWGGMAGSNEALNTAPNPNFNRREGAFTAGLFNQKSTIASLKPVASIPKSYMLKQTDTEVSACHIGPHTGRPRECGLAMGVTMEGVVSLRAMCRRDAWSILARCVGGMMRYEWAIMR